MNKFDLDEIRGRRQKDSTLTFIGGMICGTLLGMFIGFGLAALYINEKILPLILN